MRFLHIMKDEKFTKGVSDFYDNFFCDGEHEICYINQTPNKTLLRNDLKIKQKEIFVSDGIYLYIKNLNKILKEYDFVVFHSFLFPGAVKVLLYLKKRICKKVIWIEWGADLYSWKTDSNGIKATIKNKINKAIRTKCHAVVGIFPPDCDFYKKEFPKSKAKVYYAPYCGSQNPLAEEKYEYKSNLSNTVKNNETVYIQVGHSATPMVNHIDVLNSLEKFSKENIKLFLPLSYGDMEYADKVQAYAEKLFPRKTICLREMMPRDEYFALIEKVDIAIFNTYRQIALGNINRMIFKNIKLYMPENSVMYNYFVSNGVPIQKIENIEKENFEDFTKETLPDDIKFFGDFLRDYHNMDKRVQRWKTIYNDLEKSLV